MVIEKGRPLQFRAYRPGDRLEKGVWNIPIPAEGTAVVPDVVLAPVVGFDPHNYRLGYGGGFFDRTLAALPSRPLVIGLGYASQAIATIYPQPHDIAMDQDRDGGPHALRKSFSVRALRALRKVAQILRSPLLRERLIHHVADEINAGKERSWRAGQLRKAKQTSENFSKRAFWKGRKS